MKALEDYGDYQLSIFLSISINRYPPPSVKTNQKIVKTIRIKTKSLCSSDCPVVIDKIEVSFREEVEMQDQGLCIRYNPEI